MYGLRALAAIVISVAAVSASPAAAATTPPAWALQHFSIGDRRASAYQVITGPDGNIWAAAGSAGLARIRPTGAVDHFRTGLAPGTTPTGITSGPDGALWFIDHDNDRVGRMTADGTATFDLPLHGNLVDIASGADAVWVLDTNGKRIGRVAEDGTTTWLPTIAGMTEAECLGYGPRDSLWVTGAKGIFQIDPVTGQAKLAIDDAPSGCDFLNHAATAPDGSLWFPGPKQFVHVLIDGTHANVAVPHAEWSAILPTDRGLYAADDEHVVLLDPGGHVVDAWRDPFRSTFYDPTLATNSDGSAWVGSFTGHLFRLSRGAEDPMRSPLSAAIPFRRSVGRLESLAADRSGRLWLIGRHGLVRRGKHGAMTILRRNGARGAIELGSAAGRIWFVTSHAVGDIQSGKPHLVARAPRGAQLVAVAGADDGTAWITDSGRRRVGHVWPSGRARWFRGPRALRGISSDHHGGAWFVAESGWIGHVRANGRVSLQRTAPRSHPADVAVAADGTVWFTEVVGRSVDRLRPGAAIERFRVGDFNPVSVVVDAGGAAWVTTIGPDWENASGLLRFAPDGHSAAYPVRHLDLALAQAITIAPSGALYFSLQEGPVAVARFDPALDPTLGEGSGR